MTGDFDLFGDPVPDNWSKRGRPQHARTLENINKVMMLVALGRSNERIANALGITLPTLRRHYFSLIDRLRATARDQLDAAYAMKLWGEVQKGNVGAMRLWQAFTDRNDRMEIEQEMGRRRTAEKPAERPGKKILDKQRAVDADADLMAELEREAAGNATH